MESQANQDRLHLRSFTNNVPRVSISQTVAQAPATVKKQAASQTPSDQDEASAQDEETPPARKKFTSAKSLNEALYLSIREDRNTTAYLTRPRIYSSRG